MIHFDFVVSDTDGENIFDAIRQEIDVMRQNSRDATRYSAAERWWFISRVEYLHGLILKMKNTHVENSHDEIPNSH